MGLGTYLTEARYMATLNDIRGGVVGVSGICWVVGAGGGGVW